MKFNSREIIRPHSCQFNFRLSRPGCYPGNGQVDARWVEG